MFPLTLTKCNVKFLKRNKINHLLMSQVHLKKEKNRIENKSEKNVVQRLGIGI